MRPCRKCGKSFDPSKYRINHSDYVCLECKREYDQAWRNKRKALGLPCGGGRQSHEWYKKYWKKYYAKPEVRKRRALLMRKYRQDPRLAERHAARLLTRRAIQTGKIIKKPCINCGGLKVEAHHPDYGKPLEVIFLCKQCHVKLHTSAEGRQP